MQRENLRVRRGGAPIFAHVFFLAPSPLPFGVPFAKLEVHMLHISKSKSKLLSNQNLKVVKTTILKIKVSFSVKTSKHKTVEKYHLRDENNLYATTSRRYA